MTTTDERRRNLIWGREELEELTNDATLPEIWRRESAELLQRYPPLSTLRDCSDDGLGSLQVQHAHVLGATRDLFQQVRVSPTCSQGRGFSLLVILRHFY